MTKLFQLRCEKLDNAISNYLSNKMRDELDALPRGDLKARWERKKKVIDAEEAREDMLAILATGDLFKKNNIKVG